MTSMKLTKLLILALGLMALTAATSFADAAFFAFPAKRNVATNAQTGEVDRVTLVSAYGDATAPAMIPASRSIFYTFSQPISAVGTINVEMELPNGTSAALATPIDAYGEWFDIDMAAGGTIAEVRVAYNGADPNPQVVQIHFTADVSFYELNTIKLSGVRCNMDGLGQVEGSTVTVSLSNPEGDIAIDNSEDLVVAVLHHPIECEDCDPTVSFRQDGRTYDDTTTVTIGELFTNAFEPPEQINIMISDIPTGFDFVGCSGVTGFDEFPAAGSSEIEMSGAVTIVECDYVNDHVIIQINDSNESYFETIEVGLVFDMTGIPDFDQDPAVLTIFKYPEGSGAYPWFSSGASSPSPLKYKYMPITCYVYFDVDADIGGELLSVFNVSDSIWDTGIGIMNGSGAEPLQSDILFGHWWDVPQNGAVEVWMYPMYTYDANDPFGYDSGAPTYSPYTFTTSAATASLGLGLDVDGRVPNRGTWAVLVSQLCSAARLDTTMDGMANGTGALCSDSGSAFEGFIVFRTYFPSAEGVNFIADWGGASTQSHGYAMINLTRREAQDEMQRNIERMVRRRC
jgi:hypothetical protein